MDVEAFSFWETMNLIINLDCTGLDLHTEALGTILRR